MTATEILKKYWGHDQFRTLQEDIINSVLQKKDTLALLPTGGGKSVCFQVPALMNDGLCLVISPLIALMKDQVENLQKKGINALSVYSGMSFADVKRTLQNAAFGNYKFLYVSPERLETRLFLEFLPALKPTLIAVDEAHCISQWGYDFRPSYMRIANLREELPAVPVIALTASATPEVQDDICNNLLFKKGANRFKQSFVRPNLSYSAFRPVSKEKKLEEILTNVKGTGIVYCRSRKETMKITELLRMQNIPADFYHAGLSSEKRTEKQDAWINNKTRIIVCTNAFGMGIDKPDVRIVVHLGMPDCIENYYQEAGRAGRDGKRAYAVLLFYKDEATDLLQKLEIKYPSPEKIRQIYTSLMNYLQVAAGIGEGLTFDMDVASFAQHFKLNILEATYGLQALAQEGLISFSETMFKQSTAEFKVSKNDLLEFEAQHPELEAITKGLLRSYEGIFDFPSVIYETLLAKFIKLPVDAVIKDLKQLNHYGMIKYREGSQKPEIMLLRNRMYSDDFKIDTSSVSERKKAGIKRAKSITVFSQEELLCRNRMIAEYFGDYTAKDCGICDNCINNTAAKLSPEEFKKAETQIRHFIKDKPQQPSELLIRMKPLKERSVWMIISFLLAEEIIISGADGKLLLK